MSLKDLTQDLSNFKWTDYEKAGTGKSPQLDGTDYFQRPNPKSLEQMESKFGKLDTQPLTRGPYGVSNVMDGEKQGRGFIPPGSTPKGFTKDVNLLHNKSELVIGQNLTRTPLSYEVAGVTSILSYGEVTKKELNIEPQAEGAYGTKTLPISTYTSRQKLDDYTIAAKGGNNTYYGNLDLLSSRRSKFQKEDGSYTTPENPSFENEKSIQRTFQISKSYPDNTTAYTMDTQIASSWDKKLLENTGSPITPDIPSDKYGSLPAQKPMWKLEKLFISNYSDSEEKWPYKVLSVGEENDHPYIRKNIGDRHPVGNWLSLSATRAAEDDVRISKFLESPKGEIWIGKQSLLQDLNPREETRNFLVEGVQASVFPVFHFKRHSGQFTGTTYMEQADFGPLIDGEKTSFSLQNLFSDTVGELKLRSDGKTITFGGAFENAMSAMGMIDFNDQGAGGRLRFLTKRFLENKKSSFMTDLLSDVSPFGRTPKIPTQYVKSQASAFGAGNAAANTDFDGSDSLIKRYATIAYGELGNHRYGDFSDNDSLYTHREIADNTSTAIFDVNDGQGGNVEYEKRKAGNNIVQGIGQQGQQYSDKESVLDDPEDFGAGLGTIKKGNLNSYKNELTDKLNILPYGLDNDNDPDFIKFKFKDIYNNKFIVFRAILSGISDAITPEWTGTRYLGRPDQVYVYSGAERKVNFNFEVYPKTKQEFPVLMEKLNYLIGLCYPSFTMDNRMVAPFINLTLGDMFNNTPGFLDSLSIDVDDVSTWETDEGLQFPKHITCACSFTYVGKYLPTTLGKHYELDWLEDFGNTERSGFVHTGTFQVAEGGDIKKTQKPHRSAPMNELFEQGLYPEREGTQVGDSHGTANM